MKILPKLENLLRSHAMNQFTFDKDLTIRYDDTGDLMPFPEQEEGFEDNPIRQLFEQVEDLEVKEEDEE
jgi:hypothetical protein